MLWLRDAFALACWAGYEITSMPSLNGKYIVIFRHYAAAGTWWLSFSHLVPLRAASSTSAPENNNILPAFLSYHKCERNKMILSNYPLRDRKDSTMGSKTKIVVIRCKELIAGIILSVIALAILALIVISLMNRNTHDTTPPSGRYTAGVYSSSVILNGNPVDIRVTVDEDNINNIEMVNISDSVTTMYPLIQNSFEEIKSSVIANGGVEGVTYSSENKYTSVMILKAIENALDKCRTY